MKGSATEDFRKALSGLPAKAQQKTVRALQQWEENMRHPGLEFKKLKGRNNLYSMRIDAKYRAIGFFEDGVLYWDWVGSHAEYDRILK